LHDWPFHGGDAVREREEGEKGKRRRKKGVRWSADVWGLLVSGSVAG
jgi:hypothetical protein